MSRTTEEMLTLLRGEELVVNSRWEPARQLRPRLDEVATVSPCDLVCAEGGTGAKDAPSSTTDGLPPL